MPYCKYCGSAVDSDAVFCSACGKRIKAASPTTEVVLPEKQTSPPVTIRGEAISVEKVMQPDPDRVQEYMSRVTNYILAMSLLNEVYNRKDEWTDYDMELWAESEEAMRTKYNIPEISIYRQLKPERREKVQTEAPRRRNKSYTKRNTEYWAQFEKKNEGGE